MLLLIIIIIFFEPYSSIVNKRDEHNGILFIAVSSVSADKHNDLPGNIYSIGSVSAVYKTRAPREQQYQAHGWLASTQIMLIGPRYVGTRQIKL